MNPLSLESTQLIGEGSSRRCYRFPDYPDKCIKIEINASLGITEQEIKYYKRFEKRGISWEMLARFYGYIVTNQGKGAVFDMPLDADGSISQTLHYYLLHDDMLTSPPDVVLSALHSLNYYLNREHIVLRELKPQNIVYSRLRNGLARCVLVDGVGNNQLLPLASYLPAYGRRVLRRKWQSFCHYIEVTYPKSSLAKSITSSFCPTSSLQ